MNGKVSISADRKKEGNSFHDSNKGARKDSKENEIKKTEKLNSMSLIEGFQLRVKRVNVVDSPRFSFVAFLVFILLRHDISVCTFWINVSDGVGSDFSFSFFLHA